MHVSCPISSSTTRIIWEYCVPIAVFVHTISSKRVLLECARHGWALRVTDFSDNNNQLNTSIKLKNAHHLLHIHSGSNVFCWKCAWNYTETRAHTITARAFQAKQTHALQKSSKCKLSGCVRKVRVCRIHGFGSATVVYIILFVGLLLIYLCLDWKF